MLKAAAADVSDALQGGHGFGLTPGSLLLQ
jgi:hypothetical protein